MTPPPPPPQLIFFLFFLSLSLSFFFFFFFFFGKCLQLIRDGAPEILHYYITKTWLGAQLKCPRLASVLFANTDVVTKLHQEQEGVGVGGWSRGGGKEGREAGRRGRARAPYKVFNFSDVINPSQHSYSRSVLPGQAHFFFFLFFFFPPPSSSSSSKTLSGYHGHRNQGPEG